MNFVATNIDGMLRIARPTEIRRDAQIEGKGESTQTGEREKASERKRERE